MTGWLTSKTLDWEEQQTTERLSYPPFGSSLWGGISGWVQIPEREHTAAPNGKWELLDRGKVLRVVGTSKYDNSQDY
jgi:hypothetical protein